jgi:Lipocalin-like domain
MKIYPRMITLSAVLVCFVPLEVVTAVAQQMSLKDRLIGTWTPISIENVAANGTKRQPYGPNPKGVLFLDAHGKYAQIQVLPDRPKFKEHNRFKGTAEENKMALSGSYASFGTWSVRDNRFIRHVEGNPVFPNEEGKDLALSVHISGDEVTFENSTTGGGGKTITVWKRAQ